MPDNKSEDKPMAPFEIVIDEMHGVEEAINPEGGKLRNSCHCKEQWY